MPLENGTYWIVNSHTNDRAAIDDENEGSHVTMRIPGLQDEDDHGDQVIFSVYSESQL